MKTLPMFQSTQILSIALLISGCGMAAPSVPQLGNWDNLSALSQGAEIKVVVDRGKPQRGTFQRVTDDGITINFGTGDQTIGRHSVGRVEAKHAGHRGMHALMGMTIGALAGLGLGIASDHVNGNRPFALLPNGGKAAGTSAGAMLGAGIGALLPSGGWKTIYAVGE